MYDLYYICFLKDGEIPSCSKRERRSAIMSLRETSIDEDKMEVDSQEATYCFCEEVAYGEMIGCDNDGCETEWFHFKCVGVRCKPKGKWYCPNCRGHKCDVMKKTM